MKILDLNGLIEVINNIKNLINTSANSTLTNSKGYTDNKVKEYIKGLSISGKVITYTKGDGTTGTITTQGADAAYNEAGSSLGLVKSGGDVTISSGIITVNDDSHNHVISNIDGLQSALDGKATSSHSHDDKYYTEAEIDSKLLEANTYADNVAYSVKNDLLNGAGTAYDTLKELGDLIDTNVDAISALETVASNKADKSHTHSISNITNLQSTLDGKAATSHGTHVNYSTTEPVMDGSASAGSASTVARSDHKHPTDTSRASKTDLDSHTSNTTSHITSTERTNWGTAYTHSTSAHAPSNAEANQNAFSNITIGSTTISADSKTDTLTLEGSNVTLTPDATNDKVTISVANGTTSAKGVVQLTDSTSSTSTTTAATPNSVKSAYDLANTAKTNAATAKTTADSKIGSVSLASGTNNGTVKLTVDGTSTDNIAVKGLGSAAYTESASYATSGHTHNYAGSSTAGGVANSAIKLSTARTIGLSGGATGTATSFDGSANITIPVTSIDPSYIADGYTSKGFYINTHPENSPTIIPFINNDIAFLLKRGGSAVIKYDGVVQNVDISNVFDGSPSYWAIDPTGVTEVIIELTLHKVFAWTNTVYVDSGSNGWRAKNIKLEVINTNYTDDVWTVKSDNTNRTISQFKHTFNHKPVGATNEGGGFNKIRLTFSGWNSATIFRIAAIGIVNYGSSGLRETFLPRDGGETFGSISPYKNETYDLGSSSKKWNNIYAKTFNGALSGNSSTATKLETARTVQTNLGTTSTASFDGSANITPGVTGTLPIANGGTGSTTAAGALTNLGLTATATELNVLDGITATTAELNYVDGVTSNIQTQLNGKASTSHGTHVSYSTTAPVMDGTASVGTASTVSRSDHVHPIDTSRAAANHTHNYAGSSSAGGDAINSDKLDGYHADDFVKLGYKATTNWDTISESGMYRMDDITSQTTFINGMNSYGQLLVIRGSGDTISQIYCNFNDNNIFTRSANGVGSDTINWTSWRKINDSGNADTLDNYHATDFVFLQNFIAGKIGSTTAYYSTSANKDCDSIEDFVALAGGADGLHYPTANNYYYILTLRYASTAKKQIAFGYKGNIVDTVVFRTCNDSTWTGWKQLYTSANITYGTSDLTAGTSTLATGSVYYQYE